MGKLKVKSYDGRKLFGSWDVTYKIDGVRCERTEEGWRSKSGKPTLHGLDQHLDKTNVGEVYEYFAGDWASSQAIRRHAHSCSWPDLYQVWPLVDARLLWKVVTDPSAEDIEQLLDVAVARGYEGIMLRQGDTVWRKKPRETYDVKVLGIYEGFTGKNIGKLGGVHTEMGDVGMGWHDHEREEYFKHPEKIIGRIIEVQCQGLQPGTGKFRHGAKKRIRWDKE